MTPERISKELTARQREAAAILYIHQLTGETKVRTMDDLPNWLSPEWIELPLYTHRPANRIQSDAKIIEELRTENAMMKNRLATYDVLIGSDPLGDVSAVLDEVGAPTSSPDGSIIYSVFDRIRATLEPKKEG